MYFLQHIKTQFKAQLASYHDGRGVEWPWDVDTSSVVEWPKSSGEIRDEMQRMRQEAHGVSIDMEWRLPKLEAWARALDAGVDDNGEDWGEKPDEWEMKNNTEWKETGEEHPDSVWTATMEDAQAVAARNGMTDASAEEPQLGEDGREVPAPEPSPEEVARRQESLLTDRTRTQERVNQYEPGTPERAAAERELSAIQMFLNILQYGSINPPAGATDSSWRPIEWGGSYSWGIWQPLSAEMLEQYGSTGHELASWIQQRWYPVFEWQPNYCWRNVGECFNAFGYQWLPNHGRNGADWKTICEQRPNQFKKIDCRPEDAPAWALISYARNSGGSKARQASGHVEIALWEGRGYYYGAVASQPGGSQKPPHPWSYTIFMPTSKTA